MQPLQQQLLLLALVAAVRQAGHSQSGHLPWKMVQHQMVHSLGVLPTLVAAQQQPGHSPGSLLVPPGVRHQVARHCWRSCGSGKLVLLLLMLDWQYPGGLAGPTPLVSHHRPQNPLQQQQQLVLMEPTGAVGPSTAAEMAVPVKRMRLWHWQDRYLTSFRLQGVQQSLRRWWLTLAACCRRLTCLCSSSC